MLSKVNFVRNYRNANTLVKKLAATVIFVKKTSCHSESGNNISVRRVLRSQNLALRNKIHNEIEDISSDTTFKSVFNEVEKLHQKGMWLESIILPFWVRKYTIIPYLVTGLVVRMSCDGVTPNDFITCMLQKFGKRNGGVSGDQVGLSIGWKDLGLERKRARKPTTTERPICLDDAKEEQTTGIDKKMITMYNTLKKSKELDKKGRKNKDDIAAEKVIKAIEDAKHLL
ncbi:hypothetical protein MKW92_052381 [Papaver armeniacum]|nr:hypothetical protein MKW92_052381 [Papaver armeniacum]